MPAEVRSPALPANIDVINQTCADTRARSPVKDHERSLPLRRDAKREPDTAKLGESGDQRPSQSPSLSRAAVVLTP